MGIPRLASTLLPFAERVVPGTHAKCEHDHRSERERTGPQPSTKTATVTAIENASPNVRALVLDGPAVVYHVYHRLLNLKNSRRNSQQRSWAVRPSYNEINRAAYGFITYLRDRLKIKIEKVYFDGGLPSSKRDVRLARLEDGRKKLVALGLQRIQFDGQERSLEDRYSSVPSETIDMTTGQSSAGFDPNRFFHTPYPLDPLLSLPPSPPFMVAAVIEYLRDHMDESDMIEQVPGEADPYCAAAAASTGAAILTSDSDLLAYDLGPRGSVIFLNSLELSNVETVSSFTPVSEQGQSATNFRGTDHEVLLGSIYQPKSLTRRLGIPDSSLRQFCFFRAQDPAMSTRELQLLCKKPSLPPNLGASYQEFLSSYSTKIIRSNDTTDNHLSPEDIHQVQLKNSLQGIDPRLSELVVQLRTFPEEEDLHIYFPTVWEDPGRDSAWSYGESIRGLAYTLLLQALQPFHSSQTFRIIHENRRRGAIIAQIPVTVLISKDQMEQRIEAFLDHYRDHQGTFISNEPNTSVSKLWKLFGLEEVQRRRIGNGKTNVNSDWTQRYLNPSRIPYSPKSWDDVHNQACLEAVLYSFRMLKQVLSFIIRLQDQINMQASIIELASALKNLPPFPDLMGAEPVSGEHSSIGGQNLRASGTVHRRSLSAIERSSRKKSKRKRTGGYKDNLKTGEIGEVAPPKNKHTAANNKFAVLQGDH